MKVQHGASPIADEPEDPLPERAAVLVPAFEEADNLGPVVAAALAAGVGPVLVIDDGSSDSTAEAARAAGARVLRLAENLGKGGAVAAGAAAVDAQVVVLLDADLVGLKPEHVRALAAPVLSGTADMTRGTFKDGRWRTTAAQNMLPVLNGQRALLREALLKVPGLAESRYGIEVAISREAKEKGWRSLDVPLPGVSQVMKEEKRGWRRGLRVRLRMYREILGTLVARGRRQHR